MTLRDYLRETRDLTTSFFFVAPVLAFYEVGILLDGSRVRNGADVVLRSLFGFLGERGVMAFNMILLLLSIFAGVRLVKRNRPVFALGAPVLLESAVYALFFSPAVLLVESRFVPLLQPSAEGNGVFMQMVLSAGAGVYEELLFRLILVGSFFFLCEKILRLQRPIAGILSLLLASILFSGFHHLGAHGEPFETHAFFFRFFAGLLLSTIFLLRGLALAVYTHTLYDILILLQYGDP